MVRVRPPGIPPSAAAASAVGPTVTVAMTTIRPLFVALILVTASAARADDLPPAASRRIDFEHDVRPIFMKSCTRCHGAKTQKGGLRLHAREAALAGGDDGSVIEPGDAGRSRLIRYVAGLDEDHRMPPEGAGDPLTDEQVGVLRAWIEQGAVWPASPDGRGEPVSDHWAFRRPVAPTVPAVADRGWVRTPIDAFVLARLEKAGLKPAHEADRRTLIRRLSFDLLGLPPTPDEVKAFVAEKRPDAYERLVDRILASPHYGERWARRWLDKARYADTNGYEKDRERSIWPYRDWAIRAFNDDMPFDRFTVEQIAGDQLPDAGPAQRIATGFHRNTMINEEGGIDVEEFRFASVVDRVNTTGAVWLGLTIGCCQCHSHKYDPITQREYYGLMAFLNNADEPDYVIPDPDVAARRAEIESRIAAIEADLPDRFEKAVGGPHLAERQAAWEKGVPTSDWRPVAPGRVVSRKGATMIVQPDASVLAAGDKPNNDVYEVEIAIPPELPRVTAIRLEVLPDPSLPDDGPGRAPLFSVGDFILTEFQAAVRGDGEMWNPVTIAGVTEDFFEPGKPAALAIDGVPESGWTVKGGIGRPHHAVFELKDDLRGRELKLSLHQFGIHQMTIGRFRISLTSADRPVKASGVPAEVESALRVPSESRTTEQTAAVRKRFLATAPETAPAREEIAKLRKSLPQFTTSMVMQEREPKYRRTTYVHRRGEYLKPTIAVPPGEPAVLHGLPKDASRDRLGLARWLVDPENPLVGRVAMNDLWSMHFGRGLVGTPEDFGTRGERPSHPELLDWLALEFPRRGWSRKAMHRLIVTSATYRQSSRVSPELLARDPKNELLARGARYRLEAEPVRDLALAVSGLLERGIGGPSVYPPQPAGVTDLAYGMTKWPVSQGADRHRRGLYTFIKRTAPYASFLTFDMPTPEVACLRRERSNTPLQALTLLNDAVFLEAARALGTSAAAGDRPDVDRITALFQTLLSRPPSERESTAVLRFLNGRREHFRADGAAAHALVADEAVPTDSRPEIAAWIVTARALLNLDETITRE